MRPLLIATLLLGGCATSIEGIQLETVDQTYTSANKPLDIARCLKDAIPGLDVYPGEGFVSVSNRNQFGSIIQNWMIRETAEGSAIEFRRTNTLAPGMTRATRCF